MKTNLIAARDTVKVADRIVEGTKICNVIENPHEVTLEWQVNTHKSFIDSRLTA